MCQDEECDVTEARALLFNPTDLRKAHKFPIEKYNWVIQFKNTYMYSIEAKYHKTSFITL